MWGSRAISRSGKRRLASVATIIKLQPMVGAVTHSLPLWRWVAGAGGGRCRWADGMSAVRSLAARAGGGAAGGTGRGRRAQAVGGGGRARKGKDAQSPPAPEGGDAAGLLRAQVVYIGAQKCFVAMYSDLARGRNSPVLAYVAPQILERGVSGKIVVGDDVLVLPSAHTYKVTRALPRQNLIQRADPEGRPRPLASNLDQLVVCCSFGSPHLAADARRREAARGGVRRREAA